MNMEKRNAKNKSKGENRMNNVELKNYMKENGCFLLHLGMLVNSIDETKKTMDCLYGIEGWFGELEVKLGPDVSLVGPPAEFRVISTKMFGCADIELVEPYPEKCKGTAMESYLLNHGEGLHHIAYGIPSIEVFHKVHAELQERGYKTILHAITKLTDADVEFCYVEPPLGGLYVELNCAMPK